MSQCPLPRSLNTALRNVCGCPALLAGPRVAGDPTETLSAHSRSRSRIPKHAIQRAHGFLAAGKDRNGDSVLWSLIRSRASAFLSRPAIQGRFVDVDVGDEELTKGNPGELKTVSECNGRSAYFAVLLMVCHKAVPVTRVTQPVAVVKKPKLEAPAIPDASPSVHNWHLQCRACRWSLSLTQGVM